MTVCIAARATWVDDAGVTQPAVIILADRMITSRGAIETEFEQFDKTKLMWLDSTSPQETGAETVAVVVSGDLDDLEVVSQRAAMEIRKNGITLISDMAEVYSEHLQAYRRRRVEREYLERYGLSMSDFIDKQESFEQRFFDRIDDGIQSEESNVGEVIIGGIDEYGGQLIKVDDYGIHPANATGFAAIGIGADFAEMEFTSFSYTSSTHWLSALVVSFFAKKNAERAPGVGPNTDLWWILPSGHTYRAPGDKELQALKDIQENRRTTTLQLIDDGAKALGKLFVEEGHAKQDKGQEEAEEASDEQGDIPEGLETDEPKG